MFRLHRLLFGFALSFLPCVHAAEEDALPPGAIARLGSLRFYHDGEIGALAVSLDGKIIASGDKLLPSKDREPRIILWRANHGTKLHEIETPDGPINSLAFSPDGEVLAASFGQNCVGLWDTRTGQPRETKYNLPRAIRDVAFDAKGRLLMCEVEGAWTALDLANGKIVQRWNPWQGRRPLLPSGLPAEDCTFSKFSPDRQRLMFGCTRYQASPKDEKKRVMECRYVRLVDAVTDQTIAELDAKADDTCWAAFSPDGKQLFIGGRRQLQVWDVGTVRKGREFLPKKYVDPENAGDAVYSLAVSADAVAAILADHSLRVWDQKSGQLLLELPSFCTYLQPYGLISPPLLFTPDGKTLLAGFGEIVRCWNLGASTDRLIQPGHHEPVLDLHFSADGRTLKSSGDSSICYWDTKWRPVSRVGEDRLLSSKRDILKSFKGYGSYNGLAKSSDGLLCVEHKKDGLYLCKTLTGEPLRKLAKWDEDCSDCRSDFSPDDSKVLVRTFKYLDLNPQQALYDVASGKRLWQQQIEHLSCGRFSPDGKWLVCDAHIFHGTGARFFFEWKGLYVLNPATGQILHTLHQVGGYRIHTWTISPDSQRLAVTMDEKEADSVIVYGLETGQEIGRVTNRATGESDHSYLFDQLALSRDGRLLASAHPGQTAVRVWEVASGCERGRFDSRSDTITSLAFAPDGHTLLSGCKNGMILVWNLDGPISQAKREGKLTKQDAASLWEALASLEGQRGDDAVWTLARSPEVAMPLLREKLEPVRTPTPEKMARLIAALDHDEFAKRQAAAAQLKALQEPAEKSLRAALKTERSAEIRRALELVLESFGPKSPETLRRIRAVEVLEHLGSEEARKLLSALAEGMPEARLTREAKAACARQSGR